VRIFGALTFFSEVVDSVVDSVVVFSVVIVYSLEIFEVLPWFQFNKFRKLCQWFLKIFFFVNLWVSFPFLVALMNTIYKLF
jgi:hypothetical protein